MDVVDLDRRVRMQAGCIPPHLVVRLLDFGHAGVVECWAGRGEWFCAREWARLLVGRGWWVEVLVLLGLYFATGWWFRLRRGCWWGGAGEA
ncbi:hypothetical protein ACIPWL_19740, partial [Streptomyces sp. NPDC090023]